MEVRRHNWTPWRLFDLIVWDGLDEVHPESSDTALPEGEQPDMKASPLPPAPFDSCGLVGC